MSSASFPGGTSITRLQVYSDTCADGLAGGTPHVHTVSTEAYVVVGGTGVLHTLDPAGLRETPLEVGSAIWFTPGVIHRAVNHGDLRVVVVMSNAGLPEAGDAVMTFPPEIVADPERYRAAASLPADEAGKADAVRRRRDLAVEGFHRLAADPVALAAFYDHAVALVRPAADGWREIWAQSVEAQTRRTAALIDAIAGGDGHHLREAALFSAPQSESTGWGMCGRLRTHDVRNPRGGHTVDVPRV
ncbi:mannose-6-phosphate isomerase-like protein (cupin superfamily) [Actinoplanes lutulentus]|uniref:Cupin domain-containing protein n=1 Tax=Actinoplanes lutulentus TaxID=1287878 RepID=A0A327ZBI8_9ACTN|nr:cupin domain-containing protein [Actinoplanes lutulentus]MBB2947325.1 mannose-6-phosphate isomerase-like protein (cupin superfamily) [Actinoplanes lutulentus]RAK36600.1 Cupin domain-containing protein [Actinoplanes lutulentus]